MFCPFHKVLLVLFTSALLLLTAPPLGNAHHLTEPAPAAINVAEPPLSHHQETGFITPSPGKTLRPFAPGQERWNPGHRGVDLTHPLTQPVLASGAGIVSFAGFLANRHLVVINHGAHPLVPPGEELFTVYEPVVPIVSVGEFLNVGDVIGYLDPAVAHCAESCLHWGAKWGHGHSIGYLNPWLLLPQLPISLLMWDPVQ